MCIASIGTNFLFTLMNLAADPPSLRDRNPRAIPTNCRAIAFYGEGDF